jgi:heparin binding hemagglutinin HbhA
MSTTINVSKNATDPTAPLYAAIGSLDYAIEKLRDADTTLAKLREASIKAAKDAGSTVEDLPHRVPDVNKLLEEAKAVPAQALNQALEAVNKASSQFDEMAERGREVVKKVNPDGTARGLVHSAEEVLAKGRDAALKAAGDARHAVEKVTKQARSSAETVPGTVVDEAKDTAAAAQEPVEETVEAPETVESEDK